MPIKIADNLPAAKILAAERVPLIGEERAARQDIRPLRIALLNLMPNKVKTETQLARLLGATPLQIELTLLYVSSHTPKNTPQEHMIAFYDRWETIKTQKYDGLIVTGAPVEQIPFEEVDYWEELTRIFDWSQTHVHSSLDICWGAQAALYHFHKIPKYQLEEKMFGVFPHRLTQQSHPLLRGFNDKFNIPVSRHTEVRAEDFSTHDALEILAVSDHAGVCLVEDKDHNHLCMFNHLEYDATTLGDEYKRDISAGLPINVPHNYFPGDDPTRTPVNSWRAFAHLLVGNWINEVYQTTPFEIEKIGGS